MVPFLWQVTKTNFKFINKLVKVTMEADQWVGGVSLNLHCGKCKL